MPNFLLILTVTDQPLFTQQKPLNTQQIILFHYASNPMKQSSQQMELFYKLQQWQQYNHHNYQQQQSGGYHSWSSLQHIIKYLQACQCMVHYHFLFTWMHFCPWHRWHQNPCQIRSLSPRVTGQNKWIVVCSINEPSQQTHGENNVDPMPSTIQISTQ